MKPVYLFLLFISIAAACSNKNKLPKDILPQAKMQEVMWDMMRAGEFLNGYVLFKDTSIKNTDESLKWYDKVYAIHKVSREQFAKSYAYYQQHPLIMRDLFDSLSRKYSHQPSNFPDTANRAPAMPIDTGIRQLPGLKPRMMPQQIDSIKNHRRLLKKAPVKPV